MAFSTRYSKTGFLKLVHVGNTLGMAGATELYRTTSFISLDPADNAGTGITSSLDPNTIAGTTTDWTKNGSWANLNPDTSDVPDGSTVDYALLVWGTQGYDYPISALVNSENILLGLPNGTTIPITPDPTLSADGNTKFFIRAREVTSYLTSLPNTARGNYSIGHVPCDMTSNGVGWVIIVVYSNPAMPLRNITVFQGVVNNGENSIISGFFTPTSGTVSARAFTMALYGDSSLSGDDFTINSMPLQGPRNPRNDFYCGQVCNYKGSLLTQSSFGNLNCTPGQDPFLQKAVFDITNVDASGILGNGVRTATLGITGTDDLVTSGAAAFEVNTNSANLSITKIANLGVASPGSWIDYLVVVRNIGAADANNVFLYDTIPSGTTIVPNSIFVNGISMPSANIQTGISLGTLLNTTGASTITFSVSVSSSVPLGTTIPNISRASFDFVGDPSLPNITGYSESNIVNVFIDALNITLTKSVNFANVYFGTNLTYTAVIRNSSMSQPISSVIFFDTIPTDTTFVTGSLALNGVSYPSDTPSPPNGFSVGTLGANSTSTVTFSVTVNNTVTSNTIKNNSTITFNSNSSVQSNEVTSTVTRANLTGITKTVNKNYATCGEELLYTIMLPNTGNVIAKNITLFDTIPNGVTFVANSVKINGIIQTGISPLSGIPIPDIPVNGVTTVNFSVIINCT